jgi:mannose-6-phosphate isomerase-like protein (cupin superfamily)
LSGSPRQPKRHPPPCATARSRRRGGAPRRRIDAGGLEQGYRPAVFAEQLIGGQLGSSEDAFVLAEWTAEVGTHWIAPLHLHHADDEAWYILEGTLGFRLGETVIDAPTGSAVLARRGTPHTYWNAGAVEARYLLVMTPTIARLIEAIHQPGADVDRLFGEYGSQLLGWD